MSHYDCLIWVGQSYPTILDFLNEARTRGCCRKVPFWPAWAHRGTTRVFLAHHDGQAAADRGVVFGYFILGGIDIVLVPEDYEALNAILDTCRELDGDVDSEAHWDSAAGRRCAELMIEFWRERTPDDPMPFKLRDWRADLKDFQHFFHDIFIATDGNGLGSAALPIPTSITRLERPRFCPLDGMRTAPESTGRPSFYFVDPLARQVDKVFHQLVEDEVTRIRSAGGSVTREESLERLARLAAVPDDKGRSGGLSLYSDAMEKVHQYRTLNEPARPELHSFERWCGSMVRFQSPYPFYRSIPHASFRGLVQIDGDELLDRIDRAAGHRSRSHEIKLPYIVDASDNHTSKRKEELIVGMSTELKLSKSYSERVLDWLPEMMADELRTRRVIRLPNIGTFRVKEKDQTDGDEADADLSDSVEFTPVRALAREFGEIEFKVSPGLERRMSSVAGRALMRAPQRPLGGRGGAPQSD